MKKSKLLLFSMAALFSLSQAQNVSAAELESFAGTPETVVAESIEESVLPETDSTEVSETESETTESVETEAPVDETVSIPEEVIETPASDAEANPTVDTSTYENQDVANFVARMYDKFLNRDADQGGFDYWYNKLVSGELKGANIIEGFAASTEFNALDLDADAYLEIMYQGIFDRAPDEAGLATWTPIYGSGVSASYIPAQFVGSAEFTALCEKFNISRGSITLSQNRDKDAAITQFVSHFYENCFDRTGDEDGLNDWTGQLLKQTATGADISFGFFYSTEFLNKGLTDEDYVRTLYQTLLMRVPDGPGLADWVTRLEKGVTKEHIRAGFVHSAEFAEFCEEHNIKRGTVYVSESRDENYESTAYVDHLYTTILGRKPEVEDLNNWTERLNDHEFIASEFAKIFILGDEYTSFGTTDEEYIQTLFAALLKREPSASELANSLKSLEDGEMDRIALFDHVGGSQEALKVAFASGLTPIVSGWFEYDDTVYHFQNKEKTMGWVKVNGERYYMNPTTNGARQVPGWAYIDGYKLYFREDGALVQDVEYLIGPQDEYFIKVYKWGNYLTIFAKDGDNGFIIPVKAFLTSCGNATPTGYYRSQTQYRWCEMLGGSQAQWCTQIVGDFLFHSVPYAVRNNTSLYVNNMFNHLGSTRSAGCIRLQAGNAKWIYDNCKRGTLIHIDPNVNSGPFDKPNFTPVPSWHTWDPSDPTAYHLCQKTGCH